MTTEVVTARPSTTFQELVRLLEGHRISALPVVDDNGRVVGLVSEADLLVKEGYPHGVEDAGPIEGIRHRHRYDKAAGNCAANVMTREVVTVPSGTPIASAARLMVRLGIRRLPVVDAEGRLAGIVTRSDLLKVFLRPDPATHWEIEHEVVRGELGLAPGDVEVEVRDGIVTLEGEVERRSLVGEVVRRVQAVPGVIEVEARLTWRTDDHQLATLAWPVA
ncbi:MAG TPA: CBS domain-containing protein [Actinomycetes bacterium]|nr:CBS domain-containing protein [Actinomycetes bacterium]